MASARAPVELDFLGLRPAADGHGSSSIRGMKTSAIASIGAQQLRRVIAGDGPTPPPPPPKQQAPMALFYNGAVATFDNVSQDKAEAIIRMAMEVSTSGGGRVACGNTTAFAGNFATDMPLKRTRSLQQFLQKRKERRLSGLGPYQGGTGRVAEATKSFRVKEEAA